MANLTFNLFGVLYQTKKHLVITHKNTIIENEYIKIYETITEIPFIDFKTVRYRFSHPLHENTSKTLTKRNLLKTYATYLFISELKFFLRSINSSDITKKTISDISAIINEKSYEKAYEILKYKFLLTDRFHLKNTWCT